MRRPNSGTNAALLLRLCLLAVSGREGLVLHDTVACSSRSFVGRRFWVLWQDFRQPCLCRFAGLDRYAQASFMRGDEPEDGRNCGYVSNPLGLLRSVDRLATRGRTEPSGGICQSSVCWCLPAFFPQRKGEGMTYLTCLDRTDGFRRTNH